LLYSLTGMVPDFTSVKLDIIAQNQWLGDNFSAFQQRFAGAQNGSAKPFRSPLPWS